MTSHFGLIIDGEDVFRRACDQRVLDRLQRDPNTPPEDPASLAQGILYGVSAVLEVLKDSGLPLTIEGISIPAVARHIERTNP